MAGNEVGGTFSLIHIHTLHMCLVSHPEFTCTMSICTADVPHLQWV